MGGVRELPLLSKVVGKSHIVISLLAYADPVTYLANGFNSSALWWEMLASGWCPSPIPPPVVCHMTLAIASTYSALAERDTLTTRTFGVSYLVPHHGGLGGGGGGVCHCNTAGGQCCCCYHCLCLVGSQTLQWFVFFFTSGNLSMHYFLDWAGSPGVALIRVLVGAGWLLKPWGYLILPPCSSHDKHLSGHILLCLIWMQSETQCVTFLIPRPWQRLFPGDMELWYEGTADREKQTDWHTVS